MFNLYKDGLELEPLRRYCMEQGEVRLLKRGEIFEDAGKPSKYVAYVERGCFKYMVNNEEEGRKVRTTVLVLPSKESLWLTIRIVLPAESQS